MDNKINLEELLNIFHDHDKDILVRINLVPELKFLHISRSSESILGYKPEEFYDNPKRTLDIIHPKDRPLLDQLLKTDFEFKENFVFRILRKDGLLRWMEVRLMPLYSKNKRIGLAGIARDITEKFVSKKIMQKSKKL